jgi:thioredoxin reductase (NADPH)
LDNSTSIHSEIKQNSRQTPCDVLIIGAGPAGLTAGLYAARAGRSVLLMEQLSPGGQAATTWRVDNYPGVPQVNGMDLMMRMDEQARGFGVEVISSQAAALEPATTGAPHQVMTSSGPLWARTVIITTGAIPKLLSIPGESEFRGRGVSYCATCDGAFFRDQPVAVIGGGNTALEEAEFLTRFASKIYLVHRRNEFRADKIIQQQVLNHPKIEVVTPYIPKEIRGSREVTGLLLEERGNQNCRELEVKGVFIFVGLTPQTDFLKSVITLDQDGYIVTGPDLTTSVSGVFAAGDCRANYSKQIIVAAGEGAVAAIMADRYLQNQSHV